MSVELLEVGGAAKKRTLGADRGTINVIGKAIGN
jgi:hypothetical protein